jgi:hypothetical protein
VSDEEREYLNEMIRSLNNRLVDALRERDEARRECDRLARRNTILIADIEALASAINKATATTGLRVLMYRGEG